MTDIKLSKAQFSKIIQSWEFLSALFGTFLDPLMKAGPLAKNVLAPLATMASASTIIDSAIQRKMCGWGVVKAGRGITSLNEDLNIIRIIKSQELRVY